MNKHFWSQYSPFLALAVALAATLGSLYYSEIAHFVPCTLCWYQRILMYPLVALILVGILRVDNGLPAYVLPFSVAGLGVSAYHYLIQIGVVGHSGACQVGIPCDQRWISYAGFITIPLLAFTAFALISALMGLMVWGQRGQAD